ncbi:hypothetical protein [Pedobacter alluvionis]|uniref:Uncharacterized protein n=1 Tax=Pedobacter alluvionis TaxID=475253 RepID=A0A497Y4P6_9SPHI|nr:hypothetical protein [Pedobacter alluvionis]RLJ77006.1 hypothetical protein BCL90_2066 [Pedobacter alluvionis]
MKVDFKKLEVKELTLVEKKNIVGGIWQVFAAIGGLVYLAGEVAESAGRAYRKEFL